MSTLQNIQSAFFFVLLFTWSASVQASPLLVVATKSIAVEAIAPKSNPPNKFKTWKQKRIQKMIDRKIKKLQQENKTEVEEPTSPKTHRLANTTFGLGITQAVLTVGATAYFYWFGIIGVLALSLIPLIAILALILGLIAKKQIKAHPEKFSGKRKTNLGMWLSIGLPVLLILTILGVSSSFFQV